MAVAAESDHRFPRHTHQEFGIGVIVRGAQASLSGRGQVEAGAGDMITVNPGEVHDGMPIGDSGRGWRMLYFDPALMAATVNELTEGASGACEFSRPVITDRMAATGFQTLYQALTAADADVLGAQQAMLLLLSAMVERKEDADTGHQPGVRKVRQRIDDDPSGAPTLAELADIAQVSQFRLIRAFARATGLTPHAYLLQRRVDLARRLILSGNTLADTAFACGFADQSHLTRHFGRLYGISPAAFARAAS
ncbi:AraC family transcriptional regulator [Rhizobium sp. LjRoot30]|uniref:helix-turn-helix transcriptional regulator n=1 Tax=Rhizobium sp. LjRoot30 TaxID=3342320 RepID=UPI003ECFEF14